MIISSHYCLLTDFDHSELNIFTLFAIWFNYILVIHLSGTYLGTQKHKLVTEQMETPHHSVKAVKWKPGPTWVIVQLPC